jgi:predicted protein tyrosine phosphatase
MEYLFLCSMGENRSPTAAVVALNIAREKGIELKTDSAGIDKLNPTPEKIERFRMYDKIFVMESYMKRDLMVNYRVDEKKIVCMNIEDDYYRHDPQLVRILENLLRSQFAFDLQNKK